MPRRFELLRAELRRRFSDDGKGACEGAGGASVLQMGGRGGRVFGRAAMEFLQISGGEGWQLEHLVFECRVA